MSAELKIREALAAGPTPGPWSLHARSSMSVAGPGSTVVAACGGHADNSRNPDELQAELQANALLITACNPAAIAELLAELDRLRASPAPGAPGQEAAAGWNWQDMRSAPKNGAECLLDTLECGLVVAYWDSFDAPPMWRNGFDDSKLTPVRWSVLPPRIHGQLDALSAGAGEKTS